MTNDNKNKFAFPVGYHDFHKDQAFNFQLNRWYSMGYSRFEDMREVGQKINSFEEWKIEMLKLAEIAVSENKLMNAAFFFRATEFFITREDPDKKLLYNKFIDYFYKVFQDDEIKQYELVFTETLINALEHGNLELSSSSKSNEVLQIGKYEILRQKRLSEPKYAKKKVSVTFDCHPALFSFTVKDEGPGFNWNKYVDSSHQIAGVNLDSYGRGFMIIKHVMDEVYFDKTGNTITLIKNRPKK